MKIADYYKDHQNMAKHEVTELSFEAVLTNLLFMQCVTDPLNLVDPGTARKFANVFSNK